MSGQCILALDQGTTSSRAILFDHKGTILTSAQKEFKQIFPKPGWVEHDAKEIWATQIGVVGEALAKAGLSATDLAALGITNQRETTLIWDRATGEPIYHAIVWQDRRTSDMIDGLKHRGLAATFQQKTGLVLDAYFSGSKVAWLLEHVPGARERAEAGELAFGTVDTWLIYNLTGGKTYLTDVSNASRTLLFNIHTGTWDEELLAILGVPAALLPEVRSSSEVYAEATVDVLKGVKIAGIAGDQQAATFGQVCFSPGQGKNTYGTGCFMLMNTGEQAVSSHNQLLSTVGWRVNQQTSYALEGSVFVGGAVVQWLRDGLGIISSSHEVEALAASVPDNGDVYVVPAFAGLGAPHWDQYARGAVLGLTRGASAGHIARAALESIAYQSYDVVKAMEADAKTPLYELRVDGGATANNLLMQFQADILNIPIIRPKITETTAQGAAYLAGLAVGYWESQAEITALWQEDRRFEPSMSEKTRTALLSNWHKAVERAKAWDTP